VLLVGIHWKRSGVDERLSQALRVEVPNVFGGIAICQQHVILGFAHLELQVFCTPIFEITVLESGFNGS